MAIFDCSLLPCCLLVGVRSPLPHGFQAQKVQRRSNTTATALQQNTDLVRSAGTLHVFCVLAARNIALLVSYLHDAETQHPSRSVEPLVRSSFAATNCCGCELNGRAGELRDGGGRALRFLMQFEIQVIIYS